MADASDYQNQAVTEVGDPNGTMTLVAQTAWDIYSAQANVSLQLCFLYTKRAIINARMAEEVPNTDFSRGQELEDKQSQRFKALQAMYDETTAEIVRFEALSRSQRGPRYGALTTTAPIPPDDCLTIDRNDPRYSGSPRIVDLTW